MSKGKRYNEKKGNAELNEDLKGIEEEIVSKKKLPHEEIIKINKKLFENVIIAIIIMIFFLFISLGASNIESSVFLIILRVFSIVSIVVTIILFEKSYKNDSINLLLHGLECFVLAVFVMCSISIYSIYLREFDFIISTASLIFTIYYIGKSTIIYFKMRKKYFASINDISDIIKK